MESSSTLFSGDHFPCIFSEIFKTLFNLQPNVAIIALIFWVSYVGLHYVVPPELCILCILLYYLLLCPLLLFLLLLLLPSFF